MSNHKIVIKTDDPEIIFTTWGWPDGFRLPEQVVLDPSASDLWAVIKAILKVAGIERVAFEPVESDAERDLVTEVVVGRSDPEGNLIEVARGFVSEPRKEHRPAAEIELYEAWASAQRGVDSDGHRLPAYRDLPDGEQRGWWRAARAAADRQKGTEWEEVQRRDRVERGWGPRLAAAKMPDGLSREDVLARLIQLVHRSLSGDVLCQKNRDHVEEALDEVLDEFRDPSKLPLLIVHRLAQRLEGTPSLHEHRGFFFHQTASWVLGRFLEEPELEPELEPVPEPPRRRARRTKKAA